MNGDDRDSAWKQGTFSELKIPLFGFPSCTASFPAASKNGMQQNSFPPFTNSSHAHRLSYVFGGFHVLFSLALQRQISLT